MDTREEGKWALHAAGSVRDGLLARDSWAGTRCWRAARKAFATQRTEDVSASADWKLSHDVDCLVAADRIGNR
jgi:hypothetical protein